MSSKERISERKFGFVNIMLET